eukprot:TRINITY_DN61302_c0_g1_i1.p1 TRINITY_DN61302_c0_g1~~TRINITY_DN61302_c0_g1_i1.p1  ORF type:complete len:405 (+),score=40.97 TRINITY_DN61302_c0_g1_i1:53-1267(+)
MIAAALLLSASTVAAAPYLQKAPVNNKISDQYIIRLKNHERLDTLKSHLEELSSHLTGLDMQTHHVFENLAEHGFVGYSARLSKIGLNFLLKQDIIESIEEDQMRYLYDCQKQTDNVDWGLTRTNVHNFTSSRSGYEYQYTTGSTGADIDAYVIDTGIYCDNNDFKNKKAGTCTFGFSAVTNIFGQVDETDGNGHGTHVSGTIAGQTYGVAKEANLIAVKVMSDKGSGSSSNILAGIDWVVGNVKKTNKVSVANLSIGGGFSQTENDAIKSATDANIVMVVAAGNEDSDACDTSPASEPSAITVAASDDKNKRASYSNWGSCVDVFGPGSDITSTWIDSPDATNTISGTSMASPHVCGVAAKIRSHDPSLTVSEVTNKIINDATTDAISDVKGTPNLMVYSACV